MVDGVEGDSHLLGLLHDVHIRGRHGVPVRGYPSGSFLMARFTARDPQRTGYQGNGTSWNQGGHGRVF